MDDLFHEIYNDLPRQGPWDAGSTRRAFHSLPDASAIRRILDIGCGAGMQALELACLSMAGIVAADNHPVVIETLARRVKQEGFSPMALKVIANLLVIIGCLLLLGAAVSAFGCGAALIDRLQHGRGILFMDVEVLGLLTLLCAVPGGAMLFIARKLNKGRRPDPS